MTAPALALTQGDSMPAPLSAAGSSRLPAPSLLPLPSATRMSLTAGRLSEDVVVLSPGPDLVMLADLRHALFDDATLSATALRVGQAHLVSAGSDLNIGAFGTLSGGLGMLDRGNGTQSRSAVGHDIRFHDVSAALRWGHTGRPAAGEHAFFPISGAASRALPDDGQTLAANASIALGSRAQLVLGGNEHEPWDGERARTLSVGSSITLDAGNHFDLSLQRTVAAESDERLQLTWLMSLGR